MGSLDSVTNCEPLPTRRHFFRSTVTNGRELSLERQRMPRHRQDARLRPVRGCATLPPMTDLTSLADSRRVLHALEHLPAADGRLVCRFAEAVQAAGEARSADEREAACERLGRCLEESAAFLEGEILLTLVVRLAVREFEGRSRQDILTTMNDRLRAEVLARSEALSSAKSRQPG